MIKNNKILLIILTVTFFQSCDCHGTWSENIRKMNKCLESNQDNKDLCLKQMEKVNSCRPIDFEKDGKS